MNEKLKPNRKEALHIKNSFNFTLLKTKKRKTTAVIESAIYALDKARPSQNERKMNKIITNAR